MKEPRFLVPAMAAVLLLTSSCQRSTGGPLEPVPSAGMEAGPDRSVTVVEGDISAKVTARWSSTGENSMRIAYRNVGQAPRMIAIGGLKMSHAAGEAVLRTAVDATGVDLTDARADNDRPHVLFALENGNDNPAKLDLPPGASREIDAELTSFTSTGSVRPGDRIAATIPMGRQPADVTFVARSP